jgi:predicted nuclease of predicted toxin-antitoxin system
MRFLVDECTGPGVAEWLRDNGHEVFSVYDETPGISDEAIIQKAFLEKWIIVTNDKDFGVKVFREKMNHHGVILLRLEDERTPVKIDVIDKLLNSYGTKLQDTFVTATERLVRIIKTSV